MEKDCFIFLQVFTINGLSTSKPQQILEYMKESVQREAIVWQAPLPTFNSHTSGELSIEVSHQKRS